MDAAHATMEALLEKGLAPERSGPSGPSGPSSMAKSSSGLKNGTCFVAGGLGFKGW